MSWNVLESVPDLAGKYILITGCTSGVGLEAAFQLLQRNATIIMGCRNREKMASVVNLFKKRMSFRSSRIIQMHLDVSSFQSVRAFPFLLRDAGISSIYAIILNAGIVQRSFMTNSDNIELTFATNIVGHWLLIAKLFSFIRNVPSSRIVSVSSLAHFLPTSLNYPLARGEVRTGSLYSLDAMYTQTKLAAHWFTAELNRRMSLSNAHTIAVVAHPGYADSNTTLPLAPTNNCWFVSKVLHTLGTPLRQSTENGAWPLVYAASDPEPSPDFYYGPEYFFNMWGPPVRNSRVSSYAKSRFEQMKLWEECQYMTDELSPI